MQLASSRQRSGTARNVPADWQELIVVYLATIFQSTRWLRSAGNSIIRKVFQEVSSWCSCNATEHQVVHVAHEYFFLVFCDSLRTLVCFIRNDRQHGRKVRKIGRLCSTRLIGIVLSLWRLRAAWPARENNSIADHKWMGPHLLAASLVLWARARLAPAITGRVQSKLDWWSFAGLNRIGARFCAQNSKLWIPLWD